MIFEMDAKDIAAENAWFEKHKYTCRYLKSVEPIKWKDGGAIGGGRSYIITETSIGTLFSVKCSCGGKNASQLLNGEDL
jgi:hypothetical protein